MRDDERRETTRDERRESVSIGPWVLYGGGGRTSIIVDAGLIENGQYRSNLLDETHLLDPLLGTHAHLHTVDNRSQYGHGFRSQTLYLHPGYPFR